MADKPEFKISHKDLSKIVSVAKNTASTQSLPLNISKEKLIGYEAAHVAMVESVVMYLNSNGLLTTLVKMDYDEK